MPPSLVLVAQKSDLWERRAVGRDEGIAKARELRALGFFEISAKFMERDSYHINTMYSTVARLYFEELARKRVIESSPFVEPKRIWSKLKSRLTPAFVSAAAPAAVEPVEPSFLEALPLPDVLPSSVYTELLALFDVRSSPGQDVDIVAADGRRVACHRIFLAPHSSFFAARFAPNCPHDREIALPASYDACYALLQRCYSPETHIADAVALEVAQLNEMLDVDNMRRGQSTNLSSSAAVVEDMTRLKGEFTHLADVRLVCERGVSVPAHKAILAARCPYFASMFGGAYAEGSAGTVDVPLATVQHRALFAALHYFYTGRLRIGLDEDTLLDVLVLADMWQLPQLVAQCERALASLLGVHNAVALWQAAMHYRATQLARLCECTIFQHLDTLERTDAELVAELFPPGSEARARIVQRGEAERQRVRDDASAAAAAERLHVQLWSETLSS